MAIETPLHLQRSLVIHQRHAIYRAVTRIAAYALINVNAVVEINEIREIVHPVPHQRLSAAITGADRLQHGRAQPYLGMTVHAGLGRRNARKTGLLNRGMAIAAIQTDRADMVLMAEGYRLRPGHMGVSDIRRSLELNTRPQNKGEQEYRSKDRGLGYCVGSTVKNLHSIRAFSAARTSWSPVIVKMMTDYVSVCLCSKRVAKKY